MIDLLARDINPFRYWNPNMVLDKLDENHKVRQEPFTSVDALRNLELWKDSKEKKKNILIMCDDG